MRAEQSIHDDVSHRRELVTLGATSFVLLLGMSLVAPVLPLYTVELDVSTGAIGAVVAAFAFGQVLFAPFGGILASRIGFRATAIASGLITGSTALLAAAVDGYVPLLALRLVQGAGTGLFTTAVMARLLEVTPRSETGRALSRYQGSLLIAVSAGPVIGGWTAEAWGLRAPFVVWGVLSLLATVVAGLAIKPYVAPSPRGAAMPSVRRRESLVRLWAHRRFRIAMVATFIVFWARQGIRNTALPLIASDEFGMTPGVIGTVMMLATLLNAAALPHAGRVIDRSGRRPVLVWGSAATAVSVLCIAFVTGPFTLAVVVIAVGVTSGYGSISSAAVVAEIEGGDRPVALGVQRFLAQGGQAVGPMTVAVMIDGLGFRGGAVAAAVILAATAAYARWMPPDVRPAVADHVSDDPPLQLGATDEVGTA